MSEIIPTIIIFITFFLPLQAFTFAASKDLDNGEDPLSQVLYTEKKEIKFDIYLKTKEPLQPPEQIATNKTLPRVASTQSAIQLNKLPQAKQYPKDYIMQRICEVFKNNCQRAIAIARCESGLRMVVGDLHINPHSYGVFQIRALRGRPSPEQLLDLETNIQTAFKISKGGTNFSAWTCNRKV